MDALQFTPNACGVLAAMVAIIGGTITYKDGSVVSIPQLGNADVVKQRMTPRDVDSLLVKDKDSIQTVEIVVQGDQLPCGSGGEVAVSPSTGSLVTLTEAAQARPLVGNRMVILVGLLVLCLVLFAS